jgi:hypothetical protein
MHDQALLRPPRVDRLMGLEVLVVESDFALLRLDERSVHVEYRLRHRMLRPGHPQKLAVHPPQTRYKRMQNNGVGKAAHTKPGQQ